MMLIPLLLLIGLPIFAFWVWSLVDCLTRPDDTFEPIFGSASPKIVWALIIFFVHFFGTILYLFAAGTKTNPKRSGSQPRTADPEESRRILEMIASGKITAAEGQRLLAALETETQQTVAAQTRSSMPKALKIGCLLLLVLPVILIALGILCMSPVGVRHQYPASAMVEVSHNKKPAALGMAPIDLNRGDLTQDEIDAETSVIQDIASNMLNTSTHVSAESIRRTRLFRITVTTGNHRESALICNRIVEKYASVTNGGISRLIVQKPQLSE